MNFDVFWPRLEDASIDDHKTNLNTYKITGGVNKRLKNNSRAYENHQIMLEELRRIYDRDLERRVSSDAKSGIYLATITALLSLLAAVFPILFKFDHPSLIFFISLFCMSMSIVCLLRAALWSAKILKVSQFYVLDWRDAVKAGSKEDTAIVLSELLCKCIDRNYQLNNDKVTYLNMVHALFKSFSFWLFSFFSTKVFSKLLPLFDIAFSLLSDFIFSVAISFKLVDRKSVV